MAGFPEYRPRRLRRTAALRAMLRETRVTPDHLVYPLFVVPGEGIRDPVEAMPGVERLSMDLLVEEAREAADVCILAALLFGLPPETAEVGSGADAAGRLVQAAVRALKSALPGLVGSPRARPLR